MTTRGAAAKLGQPRFKAIGETIAELKKVVWLTRQEVAYLTALVLIVSISVAIALGIIDYIFTRFFDSIFIAG